MIKVAIMGYGTVGAGVYKVLTGNRGEITRRLQGEEIEVAHVLDLRDFPGDPAEAVLTHDFQDILNDSEVAIVVETMGGLRPAYGFTKQLLEAGKCVCTSNKELVAEHGLELRRVAHASGVNYLFEASCGGGIPVIHVLDGALTADYIDEVSGILNGTTNYILSQMTAQGQDFNEALKEAQAMGYAELHPEADIEGHDAQRKIAILSTLAYGKYINYKNVYTEGISCIDSVDIAFAKAVGRKIKLIARSRRTAEGTFAMVAPMMIGRENLLYNVDGVLNAVQLHGNAVGNVTLFGSGAGSLPTASAVAGDVISCARSLHEPIPSDWSDQEMDLLESEEMPCAFFVRFRGSESEARELFADAELTRIPETDEIGITTGIMTEKSLMDVRSGTGHIVKAIRLG